MDEILHTVRRVLVADNAYIMRYSADRISLYGYYRSSNISARADIVIKDDDLIVYVHMLENRTIKTVTFIETIKTEASLFASIIYDLTRAEELVRNVITLICEDIGLATEEEYENGDDPDELHDSLAHVDGILNPMLARLQKN